MSKKLMVYHKGIQEGSARKVKIMSINPEPVFNLIMNATENGLDYALTKSEYADDQEDELLESLIEMFSDTRDRIIERLTTLSNEAAVVQLAYDGGTDDYSIEEPEEFSMRNVE